MDVMSLTSFCCGNKSQESPALESGSFFLHFHKTYLQSNTWAVTSLFTGDVVFTLQHIFTDTVIYMQAVKAVLKFVAGLMGNVVPVCETFSII
jgi:hypothetical protein